MTPLRIVALATRGKLRIATLNMRGFGPANNDSISEKWMRINQIIRDNNITVLALQETHLSAERLEVLNSVFAPSLDILGSPDPENQTGARGVAFVLNKKLMRDTKYEHRVIAPGRASEIRIHWRNNAPLTIHNVYAPNPARENEMMWRSLNDAYQTGEDGRGPDFLVGDFNMVDDAMDRLPMHSDDGAQTHALRTLCVQADMVDGWRRENPSERAYTYLQTSTESQSRIDRIYVTREMEKRTMDWEITEPGVPTDHKLVSVAVTNHRTPHLGNGRWAMPASLVNDLVFMNAVTKLGIELQDRLQHTSERTDSDNPQLAYHQFKQAVRQTARDRTKVKIPKLDRRLARLREDLKRTLREPDLDLDNGAKRHAALLQDRITALEVQRFGDKRTKVAAHDWLEGETISKYWTKVNAPPKPDDIIYELERLTGTEHTRSFANRSDEMAEIAKQFFDSLQMEEENAEVEREKEAATRETLQAADARMSDREAESLEREVAWIEIEVALTDAPSGKSPGLDGIPAELWKECYHRKKKDDKRNAPAFNIILVLKKVFNDIEEYGVMDNTDFTKGWICPIYKKKDKRQIGNYRPITLLNSDYKILTRVLAERLAMTMRRPRKSTAR
ncbi:Endonuclease/exonuclease/phosphatase [Ganoderma leucocontextum]|nr:Endonuclease/exonuclease/phosphatase [Ganoderma leucocontextum]